LHRGISGGFDAHKLHDEKKYVKYEEKDSYRGHNEIQQGNDEKRSRNQHLNTGGDKKNCEKD
jgi:hypothetical protein